MTAICSGLLLIAVAQAPVPASPSATRPGDQPKPAIQVTLRFAVAELDPRDPKDSFVECVVRNDSGKPVRVPAAYVSGFDREMVLKGDAPGFGWGLWLVRWGGETKPRHELLESGKELCVFKAPLKELLLAERGPSKAAWTWEA